MSQRVTRSMSREPQPRPFPLAGQLKDKGKGKAKLEPVIDLTLDDDGDDVQVVADNEQPVPGPSKPRAMTMAKAKPQAKRGKKAAVATRPRPAPALAPAPAPAAPAPHNIDFFGDADDGYHGAGEFFEPAHGGRLIHDLDVHADDYDEDYDEYDEDYDEYDDDYDDGLDELVADMLHGDDYDDGYLDGDHDDQWMLPMPIPVVNHLAHAQPAFQPQHQPFQFNPEPQPQPAFQPVPEPMVVVDQHNIVANEPIVVPDEPIIVDDEPAAQPIIIDDAAEPAPAAAVDPLTQILEIVPDVDPEHASKLINTHLATYGAAGVVQPVLHLILEDPKYPRASKKRKPAQQQEQQQQAKKPKVDYASTDRPFAGGVAYYDLAVERLVHDFPYVPKQFVRRTLATHNGLYAPAYIALHGLEELPAELRGYARKKSATAKGKGREVDYETAEPELAKELKFIQEWRDGLDGGASKSAADPEEDEPGSEELAAELGGVECGCCFGEYQFDTLLQCPDAHLFCIACVRAYAGTKLAEGTADIRCPSSADPPCAAVFAERELRRALNDKAMGLYYRVKTRRELEAAGLDNLEECPFCEYACVVDNADEKLFRCAREECGEVSCRKCKKRDHLPKSCKEAEQDNVLDAQHAVEEAMTKALMRNCPKCSKAFVKEMGCNKMTCPYCHTLSCYVCRKVITGYDHFNQQPGGAPRPSTSAAGKCPLWDDGQDVERRHQAEVEAAAKRALAEVKAAQPEVDAAAIKVDVPVAKPRNAGPQLHAHAHAHLHPAVHVLPGILGHHQIHIHNHMPALPGYVHLAHAVQPPPMQHLAMRDQLAAQAAQQQQQDLQAIRAHQLMIQGQQRLMHVQEQHRGQRERLLAEQRERLRAQQQQRRLAQQVRQEELERQEREEYHRLRQAAVVQAQEQAAAAPRRRRR